MPITNNNSENTLATNQQQLMQASLWQMLAALWRAMAAAFWKQQPAVTPHYIIEVVDTTDTATDTQEPTKLPVTEGNTYLHDMGFLTQATASLQL